MHDLFASSNPRHDSCRAAATIAKADAAALYQPGDVLGDLRHRAHWGWNSSEGLLRTGSGSAIEAVFGAGERVLIGETVGRHFIDDDAWRRAGSPQSLLLQPLVREGASLGVLALSWSGDVRLDGPRATVTALLAPEIAAVIERADRMTELSNEANTDALTGLPNRRAWNDRLAASVRSASPMSVCIFDLDLFKEYNDSHGHPAGDRLLRTTAAAWRDQIREGDFLARIGGEEFGLLLETSRPAAALEIVERLRAQVAERRTCSAGIAVREIGETVESVVARADEQLYEAKAGGRDQARLARASAIVESDVT